MKKNPSQISSLDFYEFPAFKEVPLPKDHKIADSNRARGGHYLQLIEYFESEDKELTENEAAELMLQAYAPHADLFKKNTLASRKTGASYPFDYKNLTVDQLTFLHFSGIQTASKALKLRAYAHLTLQQHQAGSKDILTLLRLAHMAGEEPLLISHLVELTLYKLTLPLIWQSLESGQVPSSILIRFQHALNKIDLNQQYHKAIRNERALFLSNINPSLDDFMLSSELITKSLALLLKTSGMTRSFIYRNKLTYCQFLQNHHLPEVNSSHHGVIDIEALTRSESALLALDSSSFLPFTFDAVFITQSGTMFKSFAELTLETSTRIDLARVAIALELYHREHNSYPDQLTALAPAFINTLPLDLITGKPLHYRIKADGTPIIYSVGLNKVDEKGLLKKERTLGDWVWQYTLPTDFNRIDWRE